MKRIITKYKSVIVIVMGLLSLGYIGFLQYSDVFYIIRVKEVNKEIKSLNNEINSQKDNEATLNSDLETSQKELDNLKNSLTKLENDLNTAKQRLSELK